MARANSWEELLDMGLELRAGQGVSHWALVELLP
jgi:hypothetical protein